MSAEGSLLFAKYAFSPNKLGYCGPKNSRTIFDYCVANQSDEELVKLLRGFEGALPYLKIIAKSNKMEDVFDEKVVEAYWIGNRLLNTVIDNYFYDSLNERLNKKIGKNPMKWILTKPVLGAKPYHAFHVLDVYTKTGLTRSGMKTNVLETINNCLVMWGKIIKINNITEQQYSSFTIEYCPVILEKGKLMFGKKLIKDIISPFLIPKVGDYVSFHWGNVCEVLNNRKLTNLKKWSQFHLDIANKTV